MGKEPREAALTSVSHKAAIKVSVRARVSAGGRFASMIKYLLAGFG